MSEVKVPLWGPPAANFGGVGQTGIRQTFLFNSNNFGSFRKKMHSLIPLHKARRNMHFLRNPTMYLGGVAFGVTQTPGPLVS